ncbi:hypothetical protein BDN72DRAFT_787292 [Pluteus cervinus]|uniref:Uncharacterized protein n=1 Tax=Pluteus cervinus TaxID=181527 RepID=A0ACD3BBZ0_9AGAR|nr:hypothetical protein BDN72DRAFT_787292 [Pluteus cervinus]
MERVQFQQEQMLAELKDLVERNIFTKKETKQIMKNRTAYETTLVRRVAKKSDYLRYAAYEMGLEQLRRKRVERQGSGHGPPTISDYALVRRQFQIFERALKRFNSDVGLWLQYIQLAKKEGARALVGRITARALQVHPDKPGLYIIAASHELDYNSHSAARALLQRGIRLNRDSVEIWREYVRMELGFIESLQRRWEVLGIGIEGKDQGTVDPSEDIMGGDPEIGEGVLETVGPQATLEGDTGTVARREIMKGAIVKSVITSAAEALPTVELFETLYKAVEEYPSGAEVREGILAHLYGEVRKSAVGKEAAAIRLVAMRSLRGGPKGAELVEGIKHANEEILGHITDGAAVVAMYRDFVEDWCARASVDGAVVSGLCLDCYGC